MPEIFNDFQKQSLEELGAGLMEGGFGNNRSKHFHEAAFTFRNAESQKKVAEYAKRQAEAAERTAQATKRSVWIMMVSVIVLTGSSVVNLLLPYLDYAK